MGRRTIRTVAILAATLAAAVEARASRILVPQHEQGSIVVVDDRRIEPNLVIANLPGVHALASNGKMIAVAAIKPESGSGVGTDFKLAIVDIATGRVTGSVSVPGYVGHAAVSPDGRYAAAAHPERQLVSLVDLRKARTVASIQVEGQPGHVVFSRDGKQLYVSDQDSGRLSIVSTANPTKVQTVEGLGASAHLVLDPTGARIYAANASEGTVGVISLKRRKKIATLEIGPEVHGIDLSPDGKKLFAADYGEGTVIEIDVATGARRSVKVEPGPNHVTALTDTRQLIVTSGEEGLMWSIDASSLKVIARYRLEGIADQIPEVANTR